MNKYKELVEEVKAFLVALEEHCNDHEILNSENDEFEVHKMIRADKIKKSRESLIKKIPWIDISKRLQTIEVSLKCSDRYSHIVKDRNGNNIHAYCGYVPEFMPGGGGDYLDLDIDVETGLITNWNVPDQSELTKEN